MNSLRNLKVIELANVLAGPSVGQFFAELGADVIKIENLLTKGDVTRSWKASQEKNTGDISAYFSSVNWGKKSVALNLQKNKAVEIVHTLVRKADIVICSYKPGDAKKYFLDYKTLSDINDKIIYGDVTGYGSNVLRSGYDAIIQAESGFTFLNGQPNGEPIKMPVALMDILAAHQLKEGILLALIERLNTGKGCKVDVSLIQAGIASLANQSANFLVGGFIPQRMGSDHPNIVPYGTVFKTRDEKMIVLAVGTDKQFKKLCEVLEILDISNHPKYSTNDNRVINKTELIELLKAKISNYKKETILEKLYSVHVPAGDVKNMQEVFLEAPAKEIIINSGNITGVRNKVFKMNDKFSEISLSAPPHYAQHTKEVLIEALGMDEDSIFSLEKEGVLETLKYKES